MTLAIEAPATRFTRTYSEAVRKVTRYVLEDDDRKANKADTPEMPLTVLRGSARTRRSSTGWSVCWASERMTTHE